MGVCQMSLLHIRFYRYSALNEVNKLVFKYGLIWPRLALVQLEGIDATYVVSPLYYILHAYRGLRSNLHANELYQALHQSKYAVGDSVTNRWEIIHHNNSICKWDYHFMNNIYEYI